MLGFHLEEIIVLDHMFEAVGANVSEALVPNLDGVVDRCRRICLKICRSDCKPIDIVEIVSFRCCHDRKVLVEKCRLVLVEF